MATNPYFNQKFPAEQNLIQDLTVETIRMMGQDMIYVPREMINEDKIFGEAGKYKFKDAFPIEMYIESVNGFEGQEDLMTKFGIQVKDKVTLIVARKRFEKEVSEKRVDIKRPREGDLIYFPLSNGLFEINFTEHENPFYTLGKLYVYKLTCELFTYDHSIMDTGVTEIDALEKETHRKTVDIVLAGITGISAISFYEGETAGQYHIVAGQTGVVGNTLIAQGTVVNYDSSTKRLYVTTDDNFITNGTTIIKGMDSNARWYLSGITTSNTLIPKNSVSDENYGDNDVASLRAKKEDIINYCEKDPFSEGKF